MAQSSIWLPKFGVYLTITRVLFYTKGVHHWPVMSFLRGQIHDEDWHELRGYVVEWQGETISFPRIFDIPAPYVVGGGFYGPEDPRIIIEEDMPDAEPVIVFNMMADVQRGNRAMYIMRPFSNDTVVMQIAGHTRGAEKNWMPFFYRPEKTKWPSHYLHFIYDWGPLSVLRCHLLNGWCDFVYTQNVPDLLKTEHNVSGTVMRGGTNFIQMTHGTVNTYVGFPKTHIENNCGGASYRPELLLFTASSPNHFHIDYMSESLEFGDAALTEAAKNDPCGEGRILMANSISRWDRPADIMSLTFTVDDVTTQVLRVHGLEKMIAGIPGKSRQPYDSTSASIFDLQWSTAAYDVMSCTLESAKNLTLERTQMVNGSDYRKARLEKEAQLREEERKVKELTRIKLAEAKLADDQRLRDEQAVQDKQRQEDARKIKEQEIQDKVAEAFQKAKDRAAGIESGDEEQPSP